MDNPWRDPKVLGALGGAGLLALICVIGWAVSSSSGSTARKELDATKKSLDDTSEELKRAKHEAQAATEYVDTLKKARDEQAAARKKAEEAVEEAQKAAKTADQARNDAEAKADRARRDAEAAEAERKRVAADRDHQYELRQQIQQAYDDKNKEWLQLKAQIAGGDAGGAKK